MYRQRTLLQNRQSFNIKGKAKAFNQFRKFTLAKIKI